MAATGPLTPSSSWGLARALGIRISWECCQTWTPSWDSIGMQRQWPCSSAVGSSAAHGLARVWGRRMRRKGWAARCSRLAAAAAWWGRQACTCVLQPAMTARRRRRLRAWAQQPGRHGCRMPRTVLWRASWRRLPGAIRLRTWAWRSAMRRQRLLCSGREGSSRQGGCHSGHNRRESAPRPPRNHSKCRSGPDTLASCSPRGPLVAMRRLVAMRQLQQRQVAAQRQRRRLVCGAARHRLARARLPASVAADFAVAAASSAAVTQRRRAGAGGVSWTF